LQRAEDELQDQHERSEALIGTVMPRPIAERLKSDREARIADRIEQLSVLFADMRGFTGAAHDLAPDQVVEYLDRLVRMFDALAEAHGVEKIKTIGDSYMAAAGFDGRAAEHAVAVGRFALAMIEAVDGHPPLGRAQAQDSHRHPLRRRHRRRDRRDPVLLRRLGRRGEHRLAHGVRTASPDRVHVSEAYFGLTGHAFVFEERGTTDLKGLGAARTFF
jgi:adenylate cyclase